MKNKTANTPLDETRYPLELQTRIPDKEKHSRKEMRDIILSICIDTLNVYVIPHFSDEFNFILRYLHSEHRLTLLLQFAKVLVMSIVSSGVHT